MKNIFIISIFLISFEAQPCMVPIASSTMYYTPSALRVCNKWYYGKEVKSKKSKYDPVTYRATDRVCAKFESEVKMQGSGRYNPKEIYTFKKDVVIMKNDDKTRNCPTTIGRSGECMLTYISVAADANYYHMGDLISMPALKGKKMKLPDGSLFTHPGYFRVDDVGGAIDGRNRFDFYSGNMDLYDANNSFGYKGDKETTMYDKSTCQDRKKYQILSSKKDKETARIAIAAAITAATSKMSTILPAPIRGLNR
ncbi:MAG: hypothetical protein H7Z71_10270 [Moraxellaceae bacterium]|nr:hypothetical protein [Pseudobdellovibrionaceae bacterium]